MTGLASSALYQLAPSAARLPYAALWAVRDEVAAALTVHSPEVVCGWALACSPAEAAGHLAAMRAAGLVSRDGLVLLVGVAAPRTARATRAVSASLAPAATDVPGDLRERLVAALARGATYRELAESIGTNHTALRRVVNGGRISAPLAALLAAALPVAGTEPGTRSGTARGTVPAAVPAAVPFQPSSSPSDSSPEAQNQKKNPESESGSDAREGGTGTAAGTRNAVPRTTQETPEARERRERWERCKAALAHAGGTAVDLRGGAQLELALRRLVEQAQYTEADCEALGRYARERPPTFPSWLRTKGPLSLATLVRGFDGVEGSVLAELMAGAGAHERARQELRARIEADRARPMAVVPIPPEAKAALERWRADREAEKRAERARLLATEAYGATG